MLVCMFEAQRSVKAQPYETMLYVPGVMAAAAG